MVHPFIVTQTDCVCVCLTESLLESMYLHDGKVIKPEIFSLFNLKSNLNGYCIVKRHLVKCWTHISCKSTLCMMSVWYMYVLSNICCSDQELWQQYHVLPIYFMQKLHNILLNLWIHPNHTDIYLCTCRPPESIQGTIWPKSTDQFMVSLTLVCWPYMDMRCLIFSLYANVYNLI